MSSMEAGMDGDGMADVVRRSAYHERLRSQGRHHSDVTFGWIADAGLTASPARLRTMRPNQLSLSPQLRNGPKNEEHEDRGGPECTHPGKASHRARDVVELRGCDVGIGTDLMSKLRFHGFVAQCSQFLRVSRVVLTVVLTDVLEVDKRARVPFAQSRKN